MCRHFSQIPPVPDHPRIEEAILELWEQAGTFEKLRALNRGRLALQLHRRAGDGK